MITSIETIAKIESILRKTRFIVLGVALISLLLNIAFLSVFIAQRHAPFQYNEWVNSHRWLRLVQTMEPTLVVGNEWKGSEIDLRYFEPIYFDMEAGAWFADHSYFNGIMWIDNPSRLSFYVYVGGDTPVRYDNEVDWSYCGPIADHPGWHELGASCAMFFDNPTGYSVIDILYELPPTPPIK